MKLAPRPISLHRFPVKKQGRPVTEADLPSTKWASKESVKAFFGGKDVKAVFTIKLQMYLLEYIGDEMRITLISSDDEGLDGKRGTINSPLFSSDGKKIVYAGTTRGKPAFIRDAVGGTVEALRVPLDPKARVTADPHWHSENGKTWIYYSTLAGRVIYNSDCNQVVGATYRSELVREDSVGFPEITGIPGSYRGGLSKDGLWAGTSYAASALYDKAGDTTMLLFRGEQQCNPSMNPFKPGSKHMDYMMILGFGGIPYDMVDGTQFTEGQHENLWIYNKNDKIVWKAPRPDEKVYWRYDKPEWSTHPNYATSAALKVGSTDNGDLIVIKIGDLADAEEGQVHVADTFFKLAEGGFTSDSYSHLWVAE